MNVDPIGAAAAHRLAATSACSGPSAWPDYRCAVCSSPLRPVGPSHGMGPSAEFPDALQCAGCQQSYPRINGITHLITAADLARHQPFLDHYRRVRSGENWLPDPALLLTLPYPPPNTPHAAIWKRRARSFERLLVVVQAQSRGRSLAVLDLGAGPCWLSARLARRGHQVEAVDVHIDAPDGLEAGDIFLNSSDEPSVADASSSPRSRSRSWTFGRTRASLERLPYGAEQFDLVVAAASLHYAQDLALAVQEAARVLRPDGALILLDTPLYRHAQTGAAVVAQRIANQRLSYASEGADVTGAAYIERGALRRAMVGACLSYREVSLHRPPRALAGRLRRLIARAIGCTEHAQMPLVLGIRHGRVQARSAPSREAPVMRTQGLNAPHQEGLPPC